MNVVLDLDGVVYRGGTALPGAADALAALAAEHHLVFATNNSRRTPEQVVEKIDACTGHRPTPESVVTSALAAALVADRVPTMVIGGDGIRRALADRDIPVVDGPEAGQVLTGIDFAFDYDQLREAADVVRAGGRWIATNTDETFPVESGLWPGAGAIVAAVAAASGGEPEVVAGKPHEPMVRLIEGRLAEGGTVVVGDRPETDLALARAGGWRAVLALSGVTPSSEEVPPDLRPDDVISGLGDLPALLAAVA